MAGLARGQAAAETSAGATIRAVGGEQAQFAPGVAIFLDRDYRMVECPGSLKGMSFLRNRIDGAALECLKSGTLTVLTPAPDNPTAGSRACCRSADLEQAGFVRLQDPPAFQLIPTDRVWVYRKTLASGERLQFAKWTVLAGFREAQCVPEKEILDLALQTPEINLAPGTRYADANRGMNMIIGADRTPGGRIWAAWVSGADGDKGYFVAASSDDEGETWTAPRLVIDPPDHPSGVRRRTLVGNFWTDPRGRLWLFFDQSMYYFDGRAGDWYSRCDNPDAETPTWTRPERIWHGCTLQKPTVLSSGEWVLPISLWNYRGRFPELDADRRAWLFVSTDDGRTWGKLGSVLFPHFSFDEHMLIERRDGQLWLTARTAKGIYESVSADRGRTWTEPTPAPIVNTAARHFIRRLRSGRILLVKNGPIDQDVGRRQLMAFLSADEGKTWQGGLELESRDRDCSYPDGFQAPDGRIFVVYDHERTRAKEILMARFSEADVLAGRLLTPGARLRLLVNKATGEAE